MYDLSEALYKIATTYYSQEPLQITKAIYISPISSPDNDDLLTTELSEIFNLCDITEKNSNEISSGVLMEGRSHGNDLCFERYFTYRLRPSSV